MLREDRKSTGVKITTAPYLLKVILYWLQNLSKSSSQCPEAVSFLAPFLEGVGHRDGVNDGRVHWSQ